MRAVRNDESGIHVVERPEPEGDGVLVEISSCGICGTDLGLVATGPLPFTLGHEFAGMVDGTAYAIEPLTRCGSCEACREGNDNRCTDPSEVNRLFGFFKDGGLADRVRVPDYCLTPLPAGLSIDDASLVETTGVAYRGVRVAAVHSGERVCVVGGGAIGLAAVGVARHKGIDVDLEARHAAQRAAGERLGAGIVLPGAQSAYDVVIDAAGSESGLARAFELVRPGGRVVLLGFYHGLVPIPGMPMLAKEAPIIPSMAYAVDIDGQREYANAAAVLAANPEIARALITHRFSLDDAAEAFRVAADRASGAIKVVIHPNG
jgi:2-desacetyl-2-hydroxyethyl bacteriochlorophyllide A dehydrogenase